MKIPEPTEQTGATHEWVIYIDGASRNNPGPSGIGIYVVRDAIVVGKYGFFIGKKTNNQAEYYALLMALFLVIPCCPTGDSIIIYSDSLLLVNQIKGYYKVKHPELLPLFRIGRGLLDGINAMIEHVMRTHNAIADKLANDGVDKKVPLPASFITFLKKHDVTI